MNKYQMELKTAKGNNKLVYPALTKLVERATPKKPSIDGNDEVLKCDYGSCPNCEDGTMILEGTKYCEYCGQALDWSE